MNMRLVIALTLATIVTIASTPSHSAPCVGFVDVDSTSPFCPNVEWIKNRTVTLGCQASQYCPNDSVTRDAMAAFLHRLGNVLSTRVALQNVTPTPFLNLDTAPQFLYCSSPGFLVSFGPRLARGHAVLEAYGDSGPADFFGRFVESIDSGATWIDASPSHVVTAPDGFDSGVSLRLMLAPRDLVMGNRYQYGVMIGRVPGSSTTSDLRNVRCTIIISFENRNPATSPLDVDD